MQNEHFMKNVNIFGKDLYALNQFVIMKKEKYDEASNV